MLKKKEDGLNIMEYYLSESMTIIKTFSTMMAGLKLGMEIPIP